MSVTKSSQYRLGSHGHCRVAVVTFVIRLEKGFSMFTAAFYFMALNFGILQKIISFVVYRLINCLDSVTDVIL